MAIRPSRNAKKRAIVLIIVHVLIIGHVVQWLITGRTTTPIEPSEAMEFTKRGVVNVGLVFFAVALLATLVFGRWVCGWACHVVALQDLCAWMMKKCGIRPRPFRSRLLIYVPLILAVYMFIWPAFYRLAVAPWLRRPEAMPPWEIQAHLTTSDFWATFPGVMVAIPFLLIVGFATVYFLGAKGFCTYGCPYGGFFAPLEQYSPMRIRVTDACEGCGHCTAVCTSNVRVHEEVAAYDMVVDPGCMKCMDCVSVCPMEALYFGPGPSAAAAVRERRPGAATKAASGAAPSFGRKKRAGGTKGTGFAPSSRRSAASRPAPAHSAIAKSFHRYDLTIMEEVVLALVFAGSFFALRGVYELIPMLMAVGMAGVLTFMAWKGWRLIRDANVNLHRWRLRYRGRFSPAGWVFGGITAAALALTAHSGIVQGAVALGGHFDNRIDVPMQVVYDMSGSHRQRVSLDHKRDARRAIRLYTLGTSIGAGGIGLTSHGQAGIEVRLAWLHSVMGDFDEAERVLRSAVGREGIDGVAEPVALALFVIVAAQGRGDEAMEFAGNVLPARDGMVRLLDEVIAWCDQAGRLEQAIAICQERAHRFPHLTHTRRWLGLLLLETGREDEGIDELFAVLEIDPADAGTRSVLAEALAWRGRVAEAIDVLRPAVEANPEDDSLAAQMRALRSR